MTPNWFVNGMVYDWVYTSIQKPSMTGVTIPQIGAYMGPISLTTRDGLPLGSPEYFSCGYGSIPIDTFLVGYSHP